MRMYLLLLTIIMGLSLSACDRPAPIQKANETYALSQLKRFSMAQNILFVEEGRFAPTLGVLSDLTRQEQLVTKPLLDAWDGQTRPIPLNGYFYADVKGDEQKVGLIAYPADKRNRNNKIMMILINPGGDPAQWPVHSDAARIFFANANDAALPMSLWPSDAKLQADWKEVKRPSPQKGLRQAKKIYEDYRSDKPLKDPVFGENNLE